MSDVKIIQSGRFPNCHSVFEFNHDTGEAKDILMIFRDPFDPRGLDSLIDAHKWCEDQKHTVMEVISDTKPIYDKMMS